MSRAHRRDPHYRDAEQDLGGYWLVDGSTELASQNSALRPNGGAQTSMAQAQLAVGDLRAARTTIDAVLDSSWRTAETLAVASEIHRALGDDDQAAKLLAHARAIDPTVD